MMKELLRDGVNGVSVGFDLDSLAMGLERLLSDETQRKAMGQVATQDVQTFEHGRAIGVYAAGLKRLVNGD